MSPLNILFLIMGVILVLGIVMFAFSGPSLDKALARRLIAVKDRHGSANANNAMERQMRKIIAARTTDSESIFTRILPNTELLKQRISRAGKSWSLDRYLMASAALGLGVAGVLLFLGLNVFVAVIIGFIFAAFVPNMVLGMMISSRVAKFTNNFPDAIDLMVRGLRSGLPISETLGIVSTEIPEPVSGEFRMVTEKIRIGRTMDEALQVMGERLGTPEIQFFGITLNIQRETGGNLAETLANLSNVLRMRMQMKLKIKALSSEAKASAYIVGSLPFIVFTLVYMENPTYLGGFFHELRLEIAGGVAIAMLLAGAGIMAKMINFEI